MKMLISFVTCLGMAVAAGIVWVTYPTTLESELQTFQPLPPEAFEAIRNDAIAFARSSASKGIVIETGSVRSRVFELRCGNVPLLLMENGHDLLTVDVFAHADERAPGIAQLRGQLVSKLVPEGQASRPGPFSGEPSGLEAFIMKHRDGIDITYQCH
ncbi:hypothetical protein ABIA71_003887 [Stenotrophomonas sp. 2619]|uniref:hypothetical protein n=1 Tax=Stenotrophomonas sp. 2619 TaxID=3156316 RepID=UPI003393B606